MDCCTYSLINVVYASVPELASDFDVLISDIASKHSQGLPHNALRTLLVFLGHVQTVFAHTSFHDFPLSFPL